MYLQNDRQSLCIFIPFFLINFIIKLRKNIYRYIIGTLYSHKLILSISMAEIRRRRYRHDYGSGYNSVDHDFKMMKVRMERYRPRVAKLHSLRNYSWKEINPPFVGMDGYYLRLILINYEVIARMYVLCCR